ncbi:MAG TPA: hypothetical protein PKC72_12085 [Chitinophagaceae bacterium]|nr:hypothetical protein [Chitinophagaceae bacterium]
MRLARYTVSITLFLILCQVYLPAFGQLGFPITIDKPKEYEDRVLRSEKSDQKKFTVPRRFIQNTVTHYNYYFNANNKLNEVLEKAKLAYTDDYSKLLPFYNYTLEATAKDSIQLDSVAYKASTGIALHDLRNDWVDNLYLLWGASYYLRKEFDSAYLMFQFINYAFAPKEKDGYYINIGSNRDGNSAFSISTKEKKSLPRKIFSEPPSRNDAFIWQIRNFLAQDQFAEAASLIIALRDDPVFPKRLENDLHEVQALWFYKQKIWDSAAVHLEQALSNATNKQEKARWEYLVAQMYELSGQYKEAEKFYSKVTSHTTDLVLDIYARLAAIRVNRDEGEKTIEKNVAELIKMAKRDRYEEYRDIIYYMAAQMQLEANNSDAALALLLKSTQFNSNNLSHRNKVFLQIADLSYQKKYYRQAYNFYDSLNMADTILQDPKAIAYRKNTADTIATNLEIITRQDSVQRIAAMPEDERKDFVKKLVRQLRKEQGLKDENSQSASSVFNTSDNSNLFPSGNQKGEWYFYNASSRKRGESEFKSRWGNRPNVDNWRRSASIQKGVQVQNNDRPGNNTAKGGDRDNPTGEITFDALYNNLPLTPELLAESNDSLKQAMFILGKAYIQKTEDCESGTTTLESLRERFQDFQPMDEVLFNLYYCYQKSGDQAKADAIKKLMSNNYSGSNYTTIITTGKNPKSTSANPEATKTYEDIYDLFLEGKFEEAVAQKKIADSIYGKNYWTPQLLYIEAVYYIKQREDSTAKNVLTEIINGFPKTQLAAKATTLRDVLSRRKQIEEELTNLNVTRKQEDTTTTTKPVTQIVNNPTPPKDSTVKSQTNPVTNNTNLPPKDTTTTKPANNPVSAFTHNPNTSHFVVLVLNKVDPVFVNEAKNAFFRYNRETYYNKTYNLELQQLDDDNRLLVTSAFANAQEALDYVEKARPKTSTEIIPWLKGGKYSFIIISQFNLDILKSSKDMEGYKTFLNQNFPGKF